MLWDIARMARASSAQYQNAVKGLGVGEMVNINRYRDSALQWLKHVEEVRSLFSGRPLCHWRVDELSLRKRADLLKALEGRVYDWESGWTLQPTLTHKMRLEVIEELDDEWKAKNPVTPPLAATLSTIVPADDATSCLATMSLDDRANATSKAAKPVLVLPPPDVSCAVDVANVEQGLRHLKISKRNHKARAREHDSLPVRDMSSVANIRHEKSVDYPLRPKKRGREGAQSDDERDTKVSKKQEKQ